MTATSAQPPFVVTFVCTANVARSVMAACLLRNRLGADPGFEIRSAGTWLVLPGQPLSVRTRDALQRHGLRDAWHRSRQFSADDAEASSLVLVMESDHLHWVRREFPAARATTGTLKLVARDLAAAEGPDLNARVAALGLGEHSVQDWEEVLDPGFGLQSFDDCIDELAGLIDALVPALRESSSTDAARS